MPRVYLQAKVTSSKDKGNNAINSLLLNTEVAASIPPSMFEQFTQCQVSAHMVNIKTLHLLLEDVTYKVMINASRSHAQLQNQS